MKIHRLRHITVKCRRNKEKMLTGFTENSTPHQGLGNGIESEVSTAPLEPDHSRTMIFRFRGKHFSS